MFTIDTTLLHIIDAFDFKGELKECIPFGSGHINSTFRLTFENDGTSFFYILQQINTSIFKQPELLIENISGVTQWLRKKIIENNGDPSRETLTLVPTKNNMLYHIGEDGKFWRAYYFITHASCYDQVEKPEDFYQSAVAFGKFQGLLSDYPAETLHETIPDFHNTVDRFQKFLEVVKKDPVGRAASVQEEIQFVLDREALTHKLCDLQASGELPLRVTHNDTKLNNIMIDDATGKAICVIDLDTVMPGLSVNDFGDSIRFGASTGAEDETDLDKIWCDLKLFEIYTKGFLEGCAGSLTKLELDMLPYGAILMTFECGMRFLADYLDGDHYFKIHREHHNLDRCRTQFKLVKDMEQKLPVMNEIVSKYR